MSATSLLAEIGHDRGCPPRCGCGPHAARTAAVRLASAGTTGKACPRADGTGSVTAMSEREFDVIVVGAENDHVPQRLGWRSARTMDEALDMAREDHGKDANITLMHHPPFVIADVK